MDKNITDQDILDFSEKEIEVFLKHLRPVAYSSKSFSDDETQHLNIERELLDALLGIEHFKHFTFGKKTHIITDHKPLLPLFKNPLLIQHCVCQDLYIMFQSMMWHYIISMDPEWNCLIHFKSIQPLYRCR